MGVNGFTQLSITQMIEFWEPQCWYLSCKLKVMVGVSCDGKRPLPLSKQHQFRSFQILSLMRFRSFNLQFVLHRIYLFCRCLESSMSSSFREIRFGNLLLSVGWKTLEILLWDILVLGRPSLSWQWLHLVKLHFFQKVTMLWRRH